jgi:hypothetical protein
MEGDQRLEGHVTSTPSKESDGISNFLAGFSQLLKALVFVILICWALHDREFVEDWLSSLTGGELFGVKFEREAIDQATSELQKLANLHNKPEDSLDERLARKALVRAARVAPAIVGSLGRGYFGLTMDG